MNKTDLKQLKEELLNKKIQIEAYVVTQHADEAQMLNAGDTNDLLAKSDEEAEEISELLSSLAISGSLEKVLKDINQALDMIEKGAYGICKYCKKDIPIARMMVRPVSTSCVECKQQFTN